MAFSAVIRRATSSSVPLLARALCRARLNHRCSAILGCGTTKGLLFEEIIGSKGGRCFYPQIAWFSALAERKPAADAELLKVIEAEIKCAEECDDHERVEDIPKGFPFEIQDEEGKNIITLTRAYQGENIEVIVSMPSLVTGEEPEDDNKPEENADDQDGGVDEGPSQSSLPLTVRVDKGSGRSLEFSCTAYPDEVVIDAMSVKENKDDDEMIAYEGPEFTDLDENLQKAFHKYLEMRGVTALTTNFLHEYMINKDSREYLLWLKNLKQFVEE